MNYGFRHEGNSIPAQISALTQLATNLRWSWHLPTRALFESLNPDLWEESRHDPLAMLSALSRAQLQDLAQDHDVVDRVAKAAQSLERYLSKPRWYQGLGEGAPECIAYFSPEFGITEVLPQYSGGLGILAGTPIQIQLPLPENRVLRANIWRADVGRVPLLLLDSNVAENDDAARGVTDRLYGGGGDHRLTQELLLGMGGVKALRVHARLTGTPAPEVFHTNEGHAGFLGIERIRELMDPAVTEAPLTWNEALAAGRASTVFTTHTPVPAGIDRFPRGMIEHFFAGELAPGVPVEQILALGAETYDDGDPDVFNMAVMGLRLAQRANGVAKLHGVVSRGMFSGLWPGFDVQDVPITSVTNGVHVPTWVDPAWVALVRERFNTDVLDASDWSKVWEISDEDIWALRRSVRAALVKDARRRLRSSWRKRGAADAQLAWTDSALDPDVLTIGFARRVPTYKRLTLMLRDPARLKALLLHPTHPIQIIIAGKSGMKAAINGSLNLSVMDGWWDEMYDGENGWAIPTANTGTSEEERDDIESAALYELLETQVAPRFYGETVDAAAGAAGAAGPSKPQEGDLPAHWISMIKHTVAHLGPQVSANRMVAEYVQRLYQPAAEAGRLARADGYAATKEFAGWVERVRSAWPGVGIEHVESHGLADEPQIGETLQVRARVNLGRLRPEDVSITVVYGTVGESDELSDTATLPLDTVVENGPGRYQF